MTFLTDTKVSDRYLEIDLIRGLAIVMMIVFHLLYDLNFFGIYGVDVLDGFWRFFGWSCATLFLFIAGLSFNVSYARASQKLSGMQLYLKYLKRGLFLIGCGLLVTAATWVFLGGDGFVVFGILQCIGVSVILAPIFYRLGWKNIIAGTAAVVAGWLITGVRGPAWLLPLGIRPEYFTSIDFVPLLPWFGPVLFGIAAGSILYPGGIRSFAEKLPVPGPLRGLCTMGRHSLLIYLLHQPVLVLALLLIFPEKIMAVAGIGA